MLKFLVLGPLELHSNGVAHRIQGNTQAILLFALLLNGDTVTSADELMRELWGHGYPHKPENALQAHISRLRRSLRVLTSGPGRPWLPSDPAGYRLLPGEVSDFDGKDFAVAVRQVQDGGPSRPRQRAARLREALGMWRGPVLGGITGGRICQDGVRHYEEAMLTAYEMLFDAELELGNHTAVISEISELATSESPFQERYCEQQVIALCRAGRHADALDVCRGTWYRLVAAGAGSARALRSYERAILCHDPVLNTPRARAAIA